LNKDCCSLVGLPAWADHRSCCRTCL
jgi:hypothetical protein